MMFKSPVRATTSVALAVALWSMTGCSAKNADTRQKLESSGLAEASPGLPEGEGVEPASGKPELEPPLTTLDTPHFAAFDLLVNRPLAHRIERAAEGPTVAVDATSPDFVRYIHGNHANDWMLGEDLDGEESAAIKARKGSVWVPAFRPEVDHALRMRVYNPAKWENKLTVSVNGEALEPVSLEEGWQTVSIDVPAGKGLRADNELAFSFSNLGRIGGRLSGGAFAWMRLGPPAPASDAAGEETEEADESGAKPTGAAAESGSATGGDEDGEKASGDEIAAATRPEPPSAMPMEQGALQVDREAGAAWYVWIPKEAKLDLEIAAEEGCGVTAELFVEDGAKGPVSATRVTRDLVMGRGEKQKTAIDLQKWAEQVARLELRGSDACDKPVTLERAQLVVPGEKPALPEGVEPPERIIVWMIDTLRSDYLPIHFDTDVEAPNLERLAKEGASFAVSYVQGNESRTSHASFFTGQFPNQSGIVGKGTLKPYKEILPEALQKAGYHTGAHVANGYVSRNGGFAQGWDYFVNNLRDGWRIDGEGIAKHGVDWAKKNKDKKFFLYLGTIDPHVTYRAHDDIIGKYETEPYHGRYKNYLSGEALGKIKGGRHVSERDKKRIINLYKNEITFNDRAFGQLRKELEEAGLWEGTMIVISSDHGEEFWEHGSVGHGHNVHQELVHVPFIVYYPPLIPGGTIVEAGTDQVDIYPTIMEAVGVERPEKLQGKSVLSLIHNAHGGYPEPAVATQYLIHYGMQMQQWKLYLKRGEYELFDRSSDNLEKRDVADKHPLASRWLLDAMGWFRAHRGEWDKQSWGVPSKVAPGFVEKIAEKK